MTLDDRERARVYGIMSAYPDAIFVFGSNLAGIHGAGAARDARQFYGAVMGQGVGLQGRSYALPTKDAKLCSLDLMEMLPYVREFVRYARVNSGTPFAVTRFGCGYAGNTDAQMAPMLAGAPPNCFLPEGWTHAGAYEPLAVGRE